LIPKIEESCALAAAIGKGRNLDFVCTSVYRPQNGKLIGSEMSQDINAVLQFLGRGKWEGHPHPHANPSIEGSPVKRLGPRKSPP
jgi:hypothetical protein